MSKRILLLLVAAAIATAASFIVLPVSGESADVPRVSCEYLERKLGMDGVVVVDSRTGSDWRGSELKIKSAIRGKPGKEEQWSAGIPKDTELIIYCA
nr:hypothetical protein [Maridesulfovibrio sp.]